MSLPPLHEGLPELGRTLIFEAIYIIINQGPPRSTGEVHVDLRHSPRIPIEEPNRHRNEVSRNLAHRRSRATHPAESSMDARRRFIGLQVALASQPLEFATQDLDLGNKTGTGISLAFLAVAVIE
jgi:hypothetical protein